MVVHTSATVLLAWPQGCTDTQMPEDRTLAVVAVDMADMVHMGCTRHRADGTGMLWR